MTPEFPAAWQIETIENPFRLERKHKIMLAQTRQSMQLAGKQVKDLWGSFVEIGIQNIFQQAQHNGGIVEFQASDTQGVEAWYQTKFKSSAIDKYSQPVDIFIVIKINPDKNETPVKMTVATYKGNNFRYTRLIAMETEEPDERTTGHYFHFIGNDLSIIRQSVQPQTFIQTQSPAIQFFEISRENLTSEAMEFEVGLVEGSEGTNHLYEHIGGGFVMTNRLRISDPFAGTVQLIDVDKRGNVTNSAEFNLPQAVENVGKFEPAITTIG